MTKSHKDSPNAQKITLQNPINFFLFQNISIVHNTSDNKNGVIMVIKCPICNSPKITSLRTAKKIGAIVGTTGGALRGANSALNGAQLGARIGAIGGPACTILGGLSGAVLGCLIGGVSGCAFGAQLGDKLDRHILSNNLCLICSHRFNLPRQS